MLYLFNYQDITNMQNYTINNYPKYPDNPILSENYPGIIRGISGGIRISLVIFRIICGYFSEEKENRNNIVNTNEAYGHENSPLLKAEKVQ